MMGYDEDDDLIHPMADQIAALESGDEEDWRHDNRSLARNQSSHEEIFGDDDLEKADDVARAMPMADELSLKVAVRNDKWSDLNRVAPFSRIQPPSVLKGTLGGQQEVVSGGPLLEVANWGGDDAETMPVTVTFAPVLQIGFVNNDVVAGDQLLPFGIVQFGTRGFLSKARVDIGRGCQFTISAASVVLQIGLEKPTFGTPGAMQLGGMLSFLPIVRTVPITSTVYRGINPAAGPGSPLVPLDGIPGGGLRSIEVPFYAKSVTFWRFPITEAVTLSFVDSTGTGLYDFVLAPGATMLTPIPLSGDIAFILVSDTGGGGITFSRMIFNLSF